MISREVSVRERATINSIKIKYCINNYSDYDHCATTVTVTVTMTRGTF